MQQRILLFFILISTFFYNVESAQAHPKSLQTALLLPFSSGNRMVEYYEGFLLALEDIKKKGISVNLQVFDIGEDTSYLPDIFAELYWTDLDLIIGGLSDKQVKMISDYSKSRKVPYVIPFTSKGYESLNNGYVYQVNTPQLQVYTKVSNAFGKKYNNANVIFYVPNRQGNKMDFVQTLQKELPANNITYHVIESNDLSENDLSVYLNPEKNNVLISSDDTSETISKMMNPLKTLKQKQPELSVSIFGYPSWLVYANEQSDNFFRFNACFFSIFYVDPLSPQVKSFKNNYYKWFSKEMINTYPKYGLLGYDTAMYFLQKLSRTTSSFTGLQTNFSFERMPNSSGLVNTNIYLVEFHSDYTVSAQQPN
ncbi:MAG: hypothetical protein EZS26_002918 [Candidatus Ordinivivax streblomastigis]|uniref:Leucine-binding protein domain-containing protein n=1 Tax=Candidatus Ordinivivax streblomastigis TaxID=2540710 RepID=A0A5M8NV09_9BACT|nr:MAG: hypothetical protein EZS26_002918 [Candidatus Ordinivivax streblomastigis]